MTDNREYFWGRRPNRNYVSGRFGTGTKLRYFSRTFDSDTVHFATVGDEIVIRITEVERKEIRATVVEDDRSIKTLTIQRFSRLGDPNSRLHFSFVGDEINKLLSFIAGIKTVPLEHDKKAYFNDDELREIVLSRGQAQRLLAQQPDLIRQIAQSPDLQRDVMAVGYRRAQIEQFKGLMQEPQATELTWQKYFEQNTWIFGYGLSYQFVSALEGRKLEQIVRGADITGHGKRVDALMKTRGRINSLCFVEIKKPSTPLLDSEYRPGAWAPSKELVGAVAQVQTTVHEAMTQIWSRLEPAGSDGHPTGETLYNFVPRSCLVVGDLNQLTESDLVNTDQLRSFELFRGNTWRPEIITFDELLERAQFIVEHGEAGELPGTTLSESENRS